MSKIAEVLDAKFEEAIELTMGTDNAIRLQYTYEMIALDGEKGSDFRYIVARLGLDQADFIVSEDTMSEISGLNVTYQLAKINRAKGDARSFSDIPLDGMNGSLVYVDAVANRGLEMSPHKATIRLGATAIDAMAADIAQLSVVRQMPPMPGID